MTRGKPKFYQVEPFDSIREMLEKAVREAGWKTAFRYKSGDKVVRVTYREFVEQTEELGAALDAAGFGSSTIACIGENSYPWVLTYLTVLQSDGVFVPIDKELPFADICHILNESESSVVFYSKKFEELFVENVDKIPGVRMFVRFDPAETPTSGSPSTDPEALLPDARFRSFRRLLQSGQPCLQMPCSARSRDEHALKMLVYTSGTTGSSKGVMLSEHNLVSSVYYGMQVSTVYDTCLSVLPYHHTYEAVSGILVSLHKHAAICINDSLKNVLKNMQLFRPSYIYLVPAFAESFYTGIMRNVKAGGKEEAFGKLIRISGALRRIGIDLRKVFFKKIHASFGGRLRKIVCGGAPIRPEIGKFFDDIGISLINGYGITECSPLVCANNDYFNDYHTAGLKLPCIEWRIDSPNEEGIGEICVKGDIVMLGYFKQPEQTAEVLKDGWFFTGDYGYINRHEQLVITGRKKNIIVLSNGKNIYPEEIEGYIQGLDYVSEVVVRGVQNSYGEEVALLAEVFLNTDKNKKDVLKDIHSACRELPAYKHISDVIIRSEEFVKTTSRKIRRTAK